MIDRPEYHIVLYHLPHWLQRIGPPLSEGPAVRRTVPQEGQIFACDFSSSISECGRDAEIYGPSIYLVTWTLVVFGHVGALVRGAWRGGLVAKNSAWVMCVLCVLMCCMFFTGPSWT